MAESIAEWAGAGVEALARVDAARLEQLAEAARGAASPRSTSERQEAEQGLQALARLLVLTRRHLRMLGGAGTAAYGGPDAAPR